MASALASPPVKTVSKRFLVAADALAAAEMGKVIDESIVKGEIDPTWSAWDSDAEISLPVPLDDELGQYRGFDLVGLDLRLGDRPGLHRV
jgi:hypothetical protein